VQEVVKRYFGIVIGLAVASAAVFAAKLVNNVAEAKYLPDAKRGPTIVAAAPSPSTPQVERTKDGKPVIDRNMFCSTCLPPVGVTPASGPIDPNTVPMTSLPLELVATHVPEKRFVQRHAFATVLNTTTQKQGAYWIDDDIPGAGKVVGVHFTYVDFTNTASERKERISLGGEASPQPVADVAVSDVPPPVAEGDELTVAIDSGIRKVDESNFEIDRSLVEKVLANPMAVAKGARVMPSSKNGEPNGFKLYAVRPSSVFAKLGFSNGDTIHSINGMDLNSMDRVMEVYSKVRDSTNLQVTVTRRGKLVTLNYGIC
jgi:general secretion pathway protein C